MKQQHNIWHAALGAQDWSAGRWVCHDVTNFVPYDNEVGNEWALSLRQKRSSKSRSAARVCVNVCAFVFSPVVVLVLMVLGRTSFWWVGM